MSVVIFHFVLILMANFQLSSTVNNRRIRNGAPVETEKKYAVYLLKAPDSPQKYMAWTCAGAIVTPWFIVTSAACVEDVQHIYAIAGYKKFVLPSSVDQDGCTKTRKKKIVLICTPKSYELDYNKVEKWALIDIAVVKVESAYDFSDQSYPIECSYTPKPIKINYDNRFQEPGTDTMAMGWGHNEFWRKHNDLQNYNMEKLQYASTVIMEKSACKKFFPENADLHRIIDKYMICTYDAGNIDEKGEEIQQKVLTFLEGCISKTERLLGVDGPACDDEDEIIHAEGRNEPKTERKDPTFRKQNDNNGQSAAGDNAADGPKLPSICQNDHGGPLVTWVGTHEVLIGVASVFRIDDKSKCVGPNLFTSTQCNGMFLDCIINSDNLPVNTSLRRNGDFCDDNQEQLGFTIVRREISWLDHPAGPAENELKRRPNMPIRAYNNIRN